MQAIRTATAAALRVRDELGSTYGDTVVAALPEADAMALSSGVIVVTPSLLRVLEADERRAVLAHERAHIDNRHHSIRNAALLIAAANPLLRRLPEQVVYLTERWADEVAATTTTRKTTAAALVRAARLQTGPPLLGGAAHSVATGVPGRVLALDLAPIRPHWNRLLIPALLVTVAALVAIAAGERTLDLFQLAHALGRVRPAR
jgi:beta-lactamase regulating signal transducer with metallopeptidase domain